MKPSAGENLSVRFIQLAAPLILGNILQQFYNAIDAWVVGRYAGELEFAAIGVAGSVMNLFLFAVAGACTGISVIFAQLYGSGELEKFRLEHFLTVAFGVFCTIAAGAAGIACAPMILRLIQVPEELMPLACAYLSIVLLGLPAAYLYNLYHALLRAVGRTGTVLAVLTLSVSVNLGLDIYFVRGLGLGIRGAAWATVIAQALSAALCILYLCAAAPELLFHKENCRLDLDLLRRTGRYSAVTALHQSGLYIGKLLVQGAVNTAGTPVISAYAATTRIEAFVNSFGDSGSAAASVLVAQSLGAGKTERVKECFRRSFQLLLAFGLLSSVVLYGICGVAVRFMLGTETGLSYESAVGYIRIIALFYVFCFTGNAFAGYFNGCGQVSIPLIGAIGHISLRVLLSWLLVPHFGLEAVAFTTGVGWILVNLFWTMVKYQRAGNLKNKSK